jgi:copper transport protein
MVAPRRSSGARGRRIAAVLATFAGFATFALTSTVAPVTAFAHALPRWSTPHAGETLDHAPQTVVMSFGERPDPRLSAIHVLDSTGQARDRGPTTVVADVPTEFIVAVAPLWPGVYTVTWRTVSAVDGHLATGAFTFGVGVAPGGAAARADLASSPPAAGAIAGRALLYIGMVGLFGIAVIAVAAFPEPPRAVVRFLPAFAALLTVGVLIVADAQRIDDGLTVREYLGSALARGFVERAVPTALAALVLAATLRMVGPSRRRAGLAVVAGAAAIVMLMDVDTSHATAGGLPRLNGAFQWLHAMGVGVWIGGLGALLVGIRGAPREVARRAVRRFSAVAGVAIVVVGVTGLVRAGVEVGSAEALTASLFGRLVLVKIGLLAALAALGAVNRFRNLPGIPRTLCGLRRVGSAELGIAAVTLVVAGALVNTVPPASAASALAHHPWANVASKAASLPPDVARRSGGARWTARGGPGTMTPRGAGTRLRVEGHDERRCASCLGDAVLLPLPLRLS